MLIVELLHRQSIKLVSQHILNQLSFVLIFLAHGCNLGLGDGRVNLGLDNLSRQVAHVRRLVCVVSDYPLINLA